MTAIPDPSSYDEVLLAAVESNAARIVRVNPRDGSEATELDLPDILRQHWGIPASYVKLARAFGPGVTLQGLRFDGDYPMAADRSCRQGTATLPAAQTAPQGPLFSQLDLRKSVGT